MVATTGPRVFRATPLDLWLGSEHPQGVRIDPERQDWGWASDLSDSSDRARSHPMTPGYRQYALYETVARRRSAALLSEFGLGHVREYAPFDLILGALHLILRAKSLHI